MAPRRRFSPAIGTVLALIVMVLAFWSWWIATGVPGDQGGTMRADWLEDHDQATTKAKESGRPILIDFTGSDWCGWCIKLRDEVFDTGVFATWAKDHVVLLECDFPRNKPLTGEQRRQNNQLADRYHIEGFPTIVVLTAQGDEIARTGYRRGGAQAWINDLENQIRRGGR